MSEMNPASVKYQKTIFIVEDDDGIGMLLEEIFLEETYYRVILVDGSRKALDLLQTVTPDLFIADYRLPSMTGIELYDIISTMPGLKGVPFILVSANLPLDEVSKRYIVGIKKPFNVTDLVHLTEKLLQSKSV